MLGVRIPGVRFSVLSNSERLFETSRTKRGRMYKQILVATDGSPLAGKAVKAALKLARTIGARVTAFHVIAPYTPPLYSEGVGYIPITYDPKHYKTATEKHAKQLLAKVEQQAHALGVSCSGSFATDALPWDAIIKGARRHHCDLIVMASHGYRGIKGLLLGSETHRVLTHAKVPVLVIR